MIGRAVMQKITQCPMCLKASRISPPASQHGLSWDFGIIQPFKHRIQGRGFKRVKGSVSAASGNIAKEAQVENASSLDGIREIRLEKIRELREANKNPFAYNFQRTHFANELQEEHKDVQNGTVAELQDIVSVAGRIRARRVMGKLAFLSLQDDSGFIQIYVDKKQIDSDEAGSFASLKQNLDIGDIVGVKGGIRRTDKGELSVTADSLEILTKSLTPLPEKWHGLADAEKRFRQRYVDLIVTEGVKNTIRSRSKIISSIRRTLEEKNFLEVETPVLEASAGGADAKPFITYHNSLEQNFALRIATELHLKRLVVGGLERVFEIGRIFRNEGVSARHNPEFTSVEIYQAYADYFEIMDLCEELLRNCAQAVHSSHEFPYQEGTIDFGKSFRRASMHKLVEEELGVDFEQITDLSQAKEAAEKALKSHNRVPDDDTAFQGIQSAQSIGNILNLCFEAAVEETLLNPTFVIDFPVEVSPLAKAHRSKKGLVERFELYVADLESFAAGKSFKNSRILELANAFSELTDPVEQRERFQAQIDAKRASAGVAPPKNQNGVLQNNQKPDEQPFEVQMDEDFINALEIGLPPTGGIGIGIDRLVMLLTDKASIREVIAFPLMRPQ